MNGAPSPDDPRGLIPFIRDIAQSYDVDPDTAVAVARSEGLNSFASTVPGEQSYGAFQLNMLPGSMGSQFQKETGLNPADPSNEIATIDYALRRASTEGWSAFHGARAAGIPNFAGIGRTQMADDSDGDLLGAWGAKPAASKYVPVSSGGGVTVLAPSGGGATDDDLLGAWPLAKPALPANGTPAAAAPAATTTAQPNADNLPQWVSQEMALHANDPGISGTAIRTGLGALRAGGDVADTLAEGISGLGRRGANALASAGIISPQTAANVGNWADTVQQNVIGPRNAFDAAAANSPAAQAGRIGGQIVATAPLIEAGGLALGGTALGRFAMARPWLALPGAGAAAGGAASALTSAASDQPLGTQVEQGAGAGALLGPLGYGASALGRGVRNFLFGALDPETAQLASQAHQFGIPVTAGQISSSPFARFADSVLQRLPFSGYGARTAAQQSGLNRAVASEMGVTADKITPQVIQTAKQTAYNDYDAAKANLGTLNLDQGFYQDLKNVYDNAHYNLEDSKSGLVDKHLLNVLDKVDSGTQTLDPDLYQSLTRKNGPLDNAINSRDSAVSGYAGDIKNALEALVGRNDPALKALKDSADYKYFVAKSLEDGRENLVSPTGDVNPALLYNAVDRSHAPIGTLGQIGKRFMKEPPSSGTFERALTFGLGTAGLSALGALGYSSFDPEDVQSDVLKYGGIGAALLAARYGASPFLRSNLLANSMIRSGLGIGAPATNALTRAAPAAALLSRPMLPAPYVGQSAAGP